MKKYKIRVNDGYDGYERYTVDVMADGYNIRNGLLTFVCQGQAVASFNSWVYLKEVKQKCPECESNER